MFPIEMQHIGKIQVVGTVQVFGYSSRRIDEHVSDMTYLNYASPAAAVASVWPAIFLSFRNRFNTYKLKVDHRQKQP
jgi:hypothetical protein